MTQQPYGGLPPFQKSSDTSKAAAISVVYTAKTQRGRIRDYIALFSDGVTADEVEVDLDMSHQSCTARIAELVQLGQVLDTGIRRRTRTGRMARVLVVPKQVAGQQITLGLDR